MKHTNIQSNKRSIKQTINQAHHQSNQTIKERKQTNPKKKPYIKNYATPDRPPPAAAMLQEGICLNLRYNSPMVGAAYKGS